MKISRIMLTIAATAVFVATPTPGVADGAKVSNSPPFWTFAAPPQQQPAGNTKLIRSPQGLTAKFTTTELMAGHAVTLWIMFFDNPEKCQMPWKCNPGDIGQPDVRFDFHYAGGHIVNGRKTTITGHLQVGETSTSGWAELGVPFFVTPLTNPYGAQVILALHSHGPAQTGQTLASQMSSYLGGCNPPLLGDDGGFAESFEDIPDSPGECSTIQWAFHNPQNP